MSSLNSVTIIGRLGKDVETRTLPNGDMVANLTVATGEKYKDKSTGQMVESTEWHRVVLWRKTAEIAAKYLTKGALVCIEGKLKTRMWEKTPGDKRYSTEIHGFNFVMLGGKGEGQGQEQQAQGAPDAPENNLPF